MKRRELLMSVMGLVVAVTISGCGGDSKESPPNPTGDVFKLNGAEYKMVEKGTLKATESSVEGKGTILFREAMADEDRNFALGLTLEDGGSLTLVSHTDAALNGGANVTLKRAGRSLKVLLKAGAQSDDLSEEFTSLAADKPLKLSIDVHGHGHVIFFIPGQEEKEFGIPKQTGKLWGLRLDGVKVTEAKMGKAVDEH